MATTNNFLQPVTTYQEAALGFLVNEFGIIANTNSMYREFNKITNNLGSSVSFALTPRMVGRESLVANYESAVQRVEYLTVDQPFSTAVEFSAEEMIFNITPTDYMKRYGIGCVKLLGTHVESKIADSFRTAPYRFFGDGRTQLDSYGILAEAEAMFSEYGAVQGMRTAILPNLSFPRIINTGANQFTPARNDEAVRSWDLGEFSNSRWVRSNLLSKHFAGTEGNAGTTLTVETVNKDADNNVISLVLAGASSASNANAIKKYDRAQFVYSEGYSTPKFFNFIGDHVSDCPVQFQAASDAASNGSSKITVTLKVPLHIGVSKTSNPGVNIDIIPGMKVKFVPDHIAGVMYSGGAHMFAMPPLPSLINYPTAQKADPDTGISIRQYIGSIFGQNVQEAMVYDCIFGDRLIPEQSMALIIPLNTSSISL